MHKGPENPNRTSQELKYDSLARRMPAAFSRFSELSPKAQHAILEKISALRQEAEKKPEELVEEARILTGVYKMVERDINKAGRAANSRAAAEFNSGGRGLPGGPRDMKRKHTDEEIEDMLKKDAEKNKTKETEEEIVDVLSEIEESMESQLSGKKPGEKIPTRTGGHGAQKPVYKDFSRSSVRRQDKESPDRFRF